MTVLRNSTAAIHTAEMDYLGDEVTYTPEGGGASTFNAWVEFANEELSGGISRTVVRVRLVEVLKTKVPTVSKEGDRITVAIIPGVTFKPADVQEGATGETWRIPLMQVRGA